ncbi:sigma factor-like helix-turn-helix DNA-binding protein [Priestia koreensis]|uniref:sigma factor-like helix-turn-helix DNA-binding protein n=1 Tax=Priestia koreensis TaxID=284581 RepID=UPI003C6E6F7A
MDLQKYEDPLDEVLESDIVNSMLKLLDELTDREADILKKRMGFFELEPKTLEEVGQDYSVTRERIRQIESKALMKLRKKILSKGIERFDLVP